MLIHLYMWYNTSYRKDTLRMSDTIIAYKGFNEDFTCRNFQYEIGKEYDIRGKINLCKNGFHACTSPRDAVAYYPATTSRFCKVELSGTIDSSDNEEVDTKICASHIKILEEVNIIDEMIKCGEIADDLFSENEEKVITNNFLGVIQSKEDWENVRSNCHIGSRILIHDGKYNVFWKCVHIANGYYFVADTIGQYPMDYVNSFIIDDFFHDTWLYRKILSPLGNELENIFKEDLKIIVANDHKITLLSYGDLLGKNQFEDGTILLTHISDAFTYYKIIHLHGLYNIVVNNKSWLRTHTGRYNYCTSDGYPHASSNSYRNVNPLIWLK